MQWTLKYRWTVSYFTLDNRWLSCMYHDNNVYLSVDENILLFVNLFSHYLILKLIFHIYTYLRVTSIFAILSIKYLTLY